MGIYERERQKEQKKDRKSKLGPAHTDANIQWPQEEDSTPAVVCSLKSGLCLCVVVCMDLFKSTNLESKYGQELSRVVIVI